MQISQPHISLVELMPANENIQTTRHKLRLKAKLSNYDD